jgi:hypothetical protein
MDKYDKRFQVLSSHPMKSDRIGLRMNLEGGNIQGLSGREGITISHNLY